MRLAVADARPGLFRALDEVFQGAAWQRCAVHLMRDYMREAGSWQLRRRVGRIVSQAFRGRDASTVTAMYHAVCDMLEGCCPRAAAVLEEADPDALAYLYFPSSVALEAPAHQQRPGADEPRDKAQVEGGADVPLDGIAGAPGRRGHVRAGRDVAGSRYFSEAKMNELYDEGRTRGIDGTVDWARLEAEARKMLESGLELADGVETAWDINRVPNSRTPGRPASGRALHQLS